MRDVIDVPGREEYVPHTWSKKSGGFGGVYFIKTNNNPTPQPNDVTHAILSCQFLICGFGGLMLV